MAAIPAAQPQEAVGEDTALQEGVELVLDKLRQVGAGSVFGLCEEGRSMLLHQAVQRGLLGSVVRVVDRGVIAMRPPGLVSVGLHALGMENLGWCSFSGRAGQRIRLSGDHLLHAPRRRPRSGTYLARERRRRPCGNGHCAMASPAGISKLMSCRMGRAAS